MTSLDRAFTVVMQNSPKTDGRTYIVVRDRAEQPGTRARLASAVLSTAGRPAARSRPFATARTRSPIRPTCAR
jgi:hypothetical protein